jgi:hypothetical protein
LGNDSNRQAEKRVSSQTAREFKSGSARNDLQHPALVPATEQSIAAGGKLMTHPDLKSSRQIYDESVKVRRQLDDGKPRQSEDDMQREQFGPRGVPGKPDPAKMVPQRRKKTPSDFDPGHTA